MSRTEEEIKMRCGRILDNTEVVNLVKVSGSPSAAYEMIFEKTKDVSMAKAGRWLAVLRRDYPKEYQNLSQIKSSHVKSDTARKGESHEEAVCG